MEYEVGKQLEQIQAILENHEERLNKLEKNKPTKKTELKGTI